MKASTMTQNKGTNALAMTFLAALALITLGAAGCDAQQDGGDPAPSENGEVLEADADPRASRGGKADWGWDDGWGWDDTAADLCDGVECGFGEHCEVLTASCDVPPCESFAYCVADDLGWGGWDDPDSDQPAAWQVQWLGEPGFPVVESDHPYLPYRGGEWTIDVPGARYIRVHFAQFDVRWGDTVTVGDLDYSGNQGEFWTDAVEGSRVTITLDAVVAAWSMYNYGFRIDRVEYQL